MLRPGDVLRNRYRIESLLRREAISDVYLAFDLQRQATVELKVLSPEIVRDAGFIQRLNHEAMILIRLQHPNIVPFYAFERGASYVFLVLDYIPGMTLRKHLSKTQGPLPLKRVTFILYQIGSALQYAHSEGVVHLDIKPVNVVVRNDGHVLLSNFGIARSAEHTEAIRSIIYTPAYMSPEQIKREHIDHKTDVYNLGVLLFEITTGKKPFTSGTPRTKTDSHIQKIYHAHLHLKPPRPRSINKELPKSVEDIILRAMEKEPNRRWPTVWTMVREWEKAVGIDVASLLPYLSEDAGYILVENLANIPNIPSQTVKSEFSRPGFSRRKPDLMPSVPRMRAMQSSHYGRLRIRSGPLQGLEFELSRRDVLVGRSPTCTIHVPDSAVSRIHMRLQYREGAWFVKDLGSRNGTYVNGQRILVRRLFPDDEIRIGETVMVFEVDSTY